jgi:hypothetical protein
MIVYWVLAGEPMDTYLVFLPMRSLAEVDESAAKHGKAYEDAIRDGDKRMRELESVAIESSEITIYGVNPRTSYVPEEWKKMDPNFWGITQGSNGTATGGKAQVQPGREKKPQ